MQLLLISAIFAVQHWGNDGAFHHHLSMRLASVIDHYLILIFLLQLHNHCCQATPATERKLGMVGEVCNRQKNV